MEKQSKTWLWVVGVCMVIGVVYLVATFGEPVSETQEAVIAPTSTEVIVISTSTGSTLASSTATSTTTSTLLKPSTTSSSKR